MSYPHRHRLTYVVFCVVSLAWHEFGGITLRADEPANGNDPQPKWAARTGHALPSYSPGLRHAVLSPDGKLALSASGETRAILRDVASGSIKRVLVLSDRPVGVSFLPDNTPVTFSQDGLVGFWHVETGEPLRWLDTGQPSLDMKISGNGDRLASRVSDGKVILWDVAAGKPLHEITLTEGDPSFAQRLRDMDLSADGSSLMTVQFKGIVGLWDTKQGTLLREWETGEYTAHHGSLSGDGTRAFIGTLKKASSLSIWDTSTAEVIRKIELDEQTFLRDGTLNHDGSRLLIHAGGEALLFDVDKQQLLFDVGTHPRNAALAFSADQKKLLTAGNEINQKLWNAETGTKETEWRGASSETFKVIASRNGAHLVVRHGDSLNWWDLAESKVRKLECELEKIRHLAISHDGSTVAALEGENDLVAWKPLTAVAPIFRAEGTGTPSTAVALGNNGKQIATGHSDGSIRLWDLESGRSAKQLMRTTSPVESLALSGSWLLAGHATDDTNQGTAALWNVSSGRTAFEAKHKGPIHSVAIDQGETTFFCAGSDGAFVHNRTGGVCQRFSISYSFRERAYMNANGTRFLVHPAWNDMRIRTANGTELLRQKHNPVARVAFAGSGSIVWQCVGHRVAATEVATGLEVLSLQSLHSGGDWLAWTPDGKFDGSADAIELVDYTIGKAEPSLASDPLRVQAVIEAKQNLRKSNHVPGLIGQRLRRAESP